MKKHKKVLQTYHMYTSSHTLYSIICWRTFGINYSIKSSGVCYKLGTSILGQFLQFLFADRLKLHQVGWGASVHCHFQSGLSLGSCWATQGHSLLQSYSVFYHVAMVRRGRLHRLFDASSQHFCQIHCNFVLIMFVWVVFYLQCVLCSAVKILFSPLF